MSKCRVDQLTMCEFQRERFGRYEAGILVNTLSGSIIIDRQGKLVDDLWDYSVRPDFLFYVDGFLDSLQKLLDIKNGDK